MNWADWVIVIIIVMSSLFGLWRGFVKEALSLVVWAAALIIAISFRYQASVMLEPHISTPSVRDIAAFSLLFILTLIVGALITRLVSTLVKMTGLSGTDRILGIVFGIMRGLVVVMAILLLAPAVVPVDQDGWWQQSAVIPRFLAFEDWATSIFSQFFNLMLDLFRDGSPAQANESST